MQKISSNIVGMIESDRVVDRSGEGKRCSIGCHTPENVYDNENEEGSQHKGSSSTHGEQHGASQKQQKGKPK